MLRELERLGFLRGLLSNASPEVVDEWPRCALVGHFETVVFSASERLMKPDPRVFHLVCGRLSVAPKRGLYVGDGGDDELAAAASLGMTPVQVPTIRPRVEAAAHVIEAFGELLAILKPAS